MKRKKQPKRKLGEETGTPTDKSDVRHGGRGDASSIERRSSRLFTLPAIERARRECSPVPTLRANALRFALARVVRSPPEGEAARAPARHEAPDCRRHG